MNALDTRTPSVEYEWPVYVSSEPQDSEWGQPPAVYYSFTTSGATLRGQLVHESCLISRSSEAPPIDRGLAAEFEAWEAASDEAWTPF